MGIKTFTEFEKEVVKEFIKLQKKLTAIAVKHNIDTSGICMSLDYGEKQTVLSLVDTTPRAFYSMLASMIINEAVVTEQSTAAILGFINQVTQYKAKHTLRMAQKTEEEIKELCEDSK